MSDSSEQLNASNSSTISFSHTNLGDAYSRVDAQDSLEETKVSGIDFNAVDQRAFRTDNNSNIRDEYERIGSFVPRQEFNKFLEVIANESLKMAGMGPLDNIFQNFVSKLDRFGTAMVPMNTLNCGYTFITRPRLNLSIGNLRSHAVMSTLGTGDPNSVAFMIRGLLDTVLSGGPHRTNFDACEAGPLGSLRGSAVKMSNTTESAINAMLNEARIFNERAQNSALLDVNNPFLVPLCNGLKGISGFPDLTVETESTEGDLHSGDFTFVKGSDMNNRTNELSLEFRDIQGSIILSIIFYWVLAMALQAKGVMLPYLDDIYECRLNYTVSIYRFVMDTAKKHILWWAKATGCYPKSVPVGALFNVSQGEVILTSAQNFTIPFVANDVKVNDPNIFLDFNQLMRRYQPNIANMRTVESSHPSMNFMGLPYIRSTNSGLQLVWKSDDSYAEAVEQNLIQSGDQQVTRLYDAVQTMQAAKDKYEKSELNKVQSASADTGVVSDLNIIRRATIADAMKMKLNSQP